MTSDAFACFTKPMKGNLNHLIIFSVYRTLGPVIVTRTSPLFFAIFFSRESPSGQHIDL